MNSSNAINTGFNTYIESWKGYQANLNMLQQMNINSNTTIDISFASFDFSSQDPIPGLNMNVDDLQKLIAFIKSKGGKVKLSFGGATYPLSPSLKQLGAEKLASDIANIINTYGLDGVDLDIEDGQDEAQITSFMENLRNDLPNGEITLTVPGQDWGAQKWISKCAQYVDSISFMEYDIWVGQTSELDQIESDISTYTQQWGIPASKIQLGLMPGTDDMGRNLSVQDAADLATWAKSQGLSGVMIWDANRDFDGRTGQGSLAYTIAIEKALGIIN